MATFLLTWNPIKYPWDDIQQSIKCIQKDGYFDRSWSCGRSKKLKPNDRFYLLRQRVEPRGIVASGYITSAPYIDSSPYNSSGWSRYVKIRYEIILDTELQAILPRARLDEEPFNGFHWDAQGSGIRIPEEIALELEIELRKIAGLSESENKEMAKHFIEGARQEVYTTSYERHPRVRHLCLKAHGYSCSVCGFNFESIYGSVGKDFIHVHHLKPLSEKGGEYTVDPVNDLRPVCPNCHAILHRNSDDGCMSIDQLKERIKKVYELRGGLTE